MSRPSAIHRQWDFKLPVAGMAINRNGDAVAIAFGDGSLRMLPAHAEANPFAEMALHNGVSLSLRPDCDGNAFLSGGDDGKIFIVDPKLEAPTLIAEHKGRWIDHVASSPADDFRAYAIGKHIHLLNDEGKETAPSPFACHGAAGGLAFSPNGKRLAASHYGGVTLWWTNAKESQPQKLVWKGSHLGLVWQPDGKTLVTAMQENALHGWRFSDDKEMQMQGYAGKIRSFAFTVKGRFLATSGAEQVVCWPFFGGGPWGKEPLALGGSDARLVTQVAPHPQDEMIAAGYDDGMVILAPMDGRMEVMIHPPIATAPDQGAAVAGMAWNAAGDCLFVALENGILFLFTVDSVKRSLSHV